MNSLDFKPQSINRKFSTLRTFLSWAEGVGHIRSLPCLPKHTGFRVSELCSLVWADVTITLKKGTLTVQSGKRSKRREIPLNKDARSALLSLGYNDKVGAPTSILTGQQGALSPRGVEMILQKYRGDLIEISPQSLRHTFCKNLVDARVSLEKVAAIAGHESLDTTKRYYEASHHDLTPSVELIGQED